MTVFSFTDSFSACSAILFMEIKEEKKKNERNIL